MASNEQWRTDSLTNTNAGFGLFRGVFCSFHVPNYWGYGYFLPKERCELPGKLLRVKAVGIPGAQHVYYAPGTEASPTRYLPGHEVLYVAWSFNLPLQPAAGAQYSLVGPLPGPWRIWCDYHATGSLVCHVEVLRDGKPTGFKLPSLTSTEEWLDVQVVMESRAITVMLSGRSVGRYEHDAYLEAYSMSFGSGEQQENGPEVVTEYREVLFDDIPYPYASVVIEDGPEDVRSEDDALCYMVAAATPEHPRHSEGDLIDLKNGDLLVVWADYYAGEGWDNSPSYLSSSVSKDGGKSWCEKSIAIRDAHGFNLMAASLMRARSGELILVYQDRLPGMPQRGMVLSRSPDEGATWSASVPITPDDGNRHFANNASLRRLDSGRIILACREYIDGIRWPYCLYSDDDGINWQSGSRVPDPELTSEQKKGQNVNEPSVAHLADGRLLMSMRSIAGGQFFSYSADQGQTWTKPYLSPLRGACCPAAIARIPGSDDILAVWAYGFCGRTPLVSAVSSDGGTTWNHMKLLERSRYHGYGYTSITFVSEYVYLTYMHYPYFASLERFRVKPHLSELRLTVLPIGWFFRRP